MNKDLQEERAKVNFNLLALKHVVNGSEADYNSRKRLEGIVEQMKELKDPVDRRFMTREQLYENAMRKTVFLIRNTEQFNLMDIKEAVILRRIALNVDTSPLELHYVMFIPTLTTQASEEQMAKWLPLSLTHRVIGTYAQTELGHGTDLKRLETTATYDPEAQEFVINTPTVTGTKWWPGNLGKSSNHAVVMAQLWTKGKCYGIHPFIVQLRDFDTHQLMPGVKCGDIGPKYGMNSNDNGFATFENVRIPRENMLMKHSQVLKDGTYVPPSHQKVGYGSMLFVRAMMISDIATAMARACTIAIRYSCVRRQGEIVPGHGEVKVLDYQTQQFKLFPQLASVYAFLFSGFYIRQMYEKISNDVSAGNTQLLTELHAVSSGLKAFMTYEALKGCQICRLCCGGHGFSESSGLIELIWRASAACTYEGENTVLLLQTARYLVKAFRAGPDGRPSQITEYLVKPSLQKSSLDQTVQMEHLIEAFRHVAQRNVKECVQRLDQLQQRGYSPEEAWNMTAVMLTKAAKAHVFQFVIKIFMDAVAAVTDASAKEVCLKLCKLYAVYGVHQRPGKFTIDGFMSHQQLQYIGESIAELLTEIRPLAVGIVDAFDFSDLTLGSIIGRFDGNVYENLLSWAQSSPFNKNEVMPCHSRYLGAIVRGAGENTPSKL